MNYSYQLYCLKKEVDFYVGPDRLHKTLTDLHNYLILEKSKHRLTWRGIPISICIKYTTPNKKAE
jgi:hypothetical protein